MCNLLIYAVWNEIQLFSMYFIILWLAESQCYWDCKAASRENVRVGLHTLSDSCLACSLCNFCDCRLPSVHLRRSLDPCKLQWADGAGPVHSGLPQLEKDSSIFKQPCFVGWTAQLPELSHRDLGGPRTAAGWLNIEDVQSRLPLNYLSNPSIPIREVTHVMLSRCDLMGQ